MGTMRFRVYPPDRLNEDMVRQAYLSGMDRTAWPAHTSAEGGVLAIQRYVSDSGNLHVSWPVEGHGRLALATASLMEQPEPYRLPLELARGAIGQVRNQLSDWQAIGLLVPEAVHAKLALAGQRFSRAAVEQDDEPLSARYADEALRATLEAGDGLAAAFAEQSLAVRRRLGVKPPALLAGDLGTSLLDDYTSRHFLATFNAAVAPLCWRDIETTEGRFSWVISDRQIEWCRQHGLKVLAGPLLLLDPRAVPDWLYLFQDDFDSVLEFVSAFVRAAVRRYRGKVDYWIVAARLNVADGLAMSEQSRLRLVARAVELVRSLDLHTPAIVSLDQPWAEYMRQRASEFSPLHFADTLVRAGLGLAGLMMEVNAGYFPGGTLRRPTIEFSQHIDTWATLGLPLWLSLCAPSIARDDPAAERKAAAPVGDWTPAAQQAWAAQFVPLALAKPMVQGVVWNQLRDSQPHDFPHGGLFDERRKAKPALRTLGVIRNKLLEAGNRKAGGEKAKDEETSDR
jgi:hypothetical protein